MDLTRKLVTVILVGRRRRFAAIMALAMVGGIVELVGVASAMPFLALLSRPELVRTQPFIHRLFLAGGFTSELSVLIACGAAAIVFLIVANGFVFVKNAAMVGFTTMEMPRLAARVLRAYLGRDYPFFLERHSGQLAKDVLMQSDAVANTVLQGWMTAVSESATILTLTALMVWANPLVGVTMLSSVGAIVAASYYVIRKRIATLGQLSDAANGQRFEICLEVLGAAKEIKAAEAEGYFARVFEPRAQEHGEYYRRAMITQALPTSLVQALAASFLIAAALWELSRGVPPSKVVVLLSLYALAGYRLLPSLLRFSGAASQLRQFRSVLDNVVDLLKAAPPERAPVPALPLEDELKLEKVTFGYPGQGKPVFDGLDLTVRSREFLALAGGSGAGKSTLIDILLGLQRPQAGSVSVDGRALDRDSLHAWRKTVAFVPQSVFLFDSTIAENIAFGVDKQAIDMARVRAAAQLAQIADFVATLPDGYETRIGERGGRLSGGQRQRLGIARALYRQPQVLILDEPTSALDGITETDLARALEGLKGKLTLIVIAHRPSTVRLGDRIIVLEQGRISDSGAYEALVARNAHFARLMSETRRAGDSAVFGS